MQTADTQRDFRGVNCAALSGNHFLLQIFSQKFSVENVLKRLITQKVQSRMFHPRHSTMEWMDSSAMKAA